MKTSDIISRDSRPASTLSNLYYRPETKDVLAAHLNVSSTGSSTPASNYLDLSQFEFIGDRTYARYLQTRSAS